MKQKAKQTTIAAKQTTQLKSMIKAKILQPCIIAHLIFCGQHSGHFGNRELYLATLVSLQIYYKFPINQLTLENQPENQKTFLPVDLQRNPPRSVKTHYRHSTTYLQILFQTMTIVKGGEIYKKIAL